MRRMFRFNQISQSYNDERGRKESTEANNVPCCSCVYFTVSTPSNETHRERLINASQRPTRLLESPVVAGRWLTFPFDSLLGLTKT
jgi:hypothetical protein